MSDGQSPAEPTENAAPEAAPAAVETDAAPAQAAPEAPPAGDESGARAVVTGHIDPAKLQLGRSKTRVRKRGSKESDGKAEGEKAEGEKAKADGDKAREGGDKKKKRRRRRGPRVVERDELYAEKDKKDTGGKAIPKGMPPRRPPPPSQDEGSFADLLAEMSGSAKMDNRRLEVGDKVTAEIIMIGKDTAFFQLSQSQEASMSLAELMDDDGNVTAKVGDTIEAFVVSFRGGIELSKKLSRHGADPALLEEARQNKIPVEGKVTGHNKGGLEVSLMGTRGFCPMGQADIAYVEDPASFVGQTLNFFVTEVKEGGKDIVLSRRALLEKERKEKAAEVIKGLQVGRIIDGTISRIQPFGAFVDLGGVDGLIPISELSHARIKDPSEVVSEGEKVTVEVTKVEPDPKREGELRIGLSLRSTQPTPMDAHGSKLIPGSNVEGTIMRLESFGAFCEILGKGSGVEGLIHVSELSDRRVNHPREVVSEGDSVTVRILDVDTGRGRISLSIKDADLPLGKTRDDVKRDQVAGIARGVEVSGMVDRIERYGVFLKLDGGASALMPASETGTERGTDLSRAFPLGTELNVMVIDIDDRGRIKVSKTAKERAEERKIVEQYSGGSSGGGSGLGTFADLLKGKLGK